MIQHAVLNGTHVNDRVADILQNGGRPVVVTKPGAIGCALFGPYLEFDPGFYIAEIDVLMQATQDDGADECCGFADVTANSGAATLCAQHLYPSRLRRGVTTISMPFSLGERQAVEIRLHVNGRAQLRALCARRITPIDHHSKWRCFGIAAPEQHPFEFDNFSLFYDAYNRGANLSLDEHGIVVSINGVSFYVKSHEDWQTADEIFLRNDYFFISPRQKVVVDIGMNAGLASLFMANGPSVLRVHSFEPFAAPYQRALQNFALNPGIAGKIMAIRRGLSGEASISEVPVSRDRTISTSVRGYAEGDAVDRIVLDEAGPVLQRIIAEAQRDGADVFLKVDCEGSEFGIFKSLERHGLFGSIAGVVVEWHKWWSPTASKADLFAPLLAAGFVIVDRTTKHDMWAGLFYAVRTGR